MKKVFTGIDGLLILVPEIYSDKRGFFYESFSEKTLNELGLRIRFVQENHSYSKHKNTFRGLHCQQGAGSQITLIRVTSGAVRDFMVDMRVNSDTYGKVFDCILSAENRNQAFIPRGILHGFLSLTDDVHMLYKMDNFYQPECEVFLNVFDPFFDLDLEVPKERLLMSDRDRTAPFLGTKSLEFSS